MTNLRRVLQEKGYSGKTFAEACGVGHSIIYKYMCGNRRLSRKTAKRFAAILKVKPEDIMEDQ